MAMDDLPLECLEFIIRELSSKADLHSLLTTNKRLCAVTLPFLYTNPFGWLISEVKQNTYHPGLHKLIICLLKSHSMEYWTPVLAAAFSLYSAGDYLTTTSGIDYLAYAQHLDLTGLPIDSAYQFSSPSIQGYMKESRLESSYHSKELDLENNPYVHKDVVSRRYFQVDVRVALVWALCRPILGHIKSLSLPVSDLPRYIEVAGQLQDLTSLTFILDKKHDRPQYLINMLREQNPDLVQAMKQAKHQEMSQMVGFVQQHTQLLPRRLMSVECPQDSTWPGMEQSCPSLYRGQIRACLPPYQPKAINKHNWPDFVENIDHLDYTLLEKINVDPQYDIPWLQFLKSRGAAGLEILRHSRNMRIFDISSPGCRPFHWARKDAEKRRLQELSNMPSPVVSTSMADPPPGSLVPPPSSPPPAMPIKAVRLRIPISQMSDELDDVAFAFSNTLEIFVVRCLQLETHFHHPIPVDIGAGWDLPLLRLFRIACKAGTMQVDPDLLSRTPNLETLDLNDGLNFYRCSEVTPWSPARLPKLKVLRLTGSAAIAFHPEILRHCHLLEELTLGMHSWNPSMTFIPSPAEILQSERVLSTTETNLEDELESLSLSGSFTRPTWRWDWHLPNLTRIQLASEFGWRFQFRMLQGCPNLELLILITTTGESLEEQGQEQQQQQQQQQQRQQQQQHLRILNKEDFEDAAGNTIVASKLVEFHLQGQWSISDTILSWMLKTVMPHLTELNEEGCSGFTFKGWMNATNHLEKLKRTSCQLFVDEAELKLAGLCAVLPGATGYGDIRIVEEEVEEGDDPRMQVMHTDPKDTRVVYTFNERLRYVKDV